MTYEEVFEYSDEYWDCECEEEFIHPNSLNICLICGAEQDDCPPSRQNEVNLAKRAGWLK